MGMTKEQRVIKKIMKETIANMESLGIYREEFTATIKAYAQLRYLYDLLNERFAEGGFLVTESYTNKAGATNIRKTAEYMALETLRKDILTHETVLGLNPTGLKKIRADTKPKKESKLEAALSGLQ